MAAFVQAALHLTLMVDRSERPVAEERQDNDRDQGGDIGSASTVAVVVRRRKFAHAIRLDAVSSILPSASSDLATMPFASSPAAAYIRSGLS